MKPDRKNGLPGWGVALALLLALALIVVIGEFEFLLTKRMQIAMVAFAGLSIVAIGIIFLESKAEFLPPVLIGLGLAITFAGPYIFVWLTS